MPAHMADASEARNPGKLGLGAARFRLDHLVQRAGRGLVVRAIDDQRGDLEHALVARGPAHLAQAPASADRADRFARLVACPQPMRALLLEHWRDTDDGAALSSILAHSELVPAELAPAQAELHEIIERLLAQAAQARRRNALMHGVPPSQLDAEQRAEVLALLKQGGGAPT